MNEKLKIQFRIKAVDRFSATMAKAEEALDSLQRKANESYSVWVGAYTHGFEDAIADVTKFGTAAEAVDGKDVYVDFTSEGYARVMGQMVAFREAVPEDQTVSVKFDVERNIADRIDKIRNSLEGMNDIDIETKFEQVGMANALGEFAAFKAARPKSATVTTRFKVTGATSKQLDDMRESMTKLRESAIELGEADINVDNLRQITDVGRDMREVTRAFRDTRRELNKPLKVEAETEEATSGFRVLFGTIRDGFTSSQRSVGRMATVMRNFGELFQHTFVTGILTALPAIVPMLASVGGALGALIPIVGVLGGGLFTMASALGLATGGWVAFAALAATSLGDVFDASSDIKNLNDKLAVAKGEKERAKILEDIANRMSLLSKEQQRALSSLNGLKSTWGSIAGSLEGQTVTTFALAMDGLADTLDRLRPMFASVSEHAEAFVRWLNFQIETDDLSAFFDLLNTRGGPSMFNMSKAFTNFAIGIMNMMTAFDPLVQQFESGFIRMSESFRNWAANLGASDKFQAFMDYVAENGPKLLTIIGNIVGGFVGMGIAFAPFAEKMLDGFVEMTQKFEDWGYALAENEGFQKFIAYVEENGPKVLDFLREFRNFLINVAVAFAPLGEAVMIFLTDMFKLFNSFMENNRAASELIAVLGWAVSAFLLLAPPVIVILTFLSKLWPVVMTVFKWVGKLWPVITRMGGAFKGAIPFIMRVLGFLSNFAGPIGMAIKAVVLLGGVIYTYWDEIEGWTRDLVENMIKKFGELGLKALGKFREMRTKIENFFSNFSLADMGKALIETFLGGIEDKFPRITAVMKGVAGAVSRFLPNSPAKEGPLSDLDKRDFAGPLSKSILNSTRAVRSAMSHVMDFPVYAPSTEVYAARSAGYTTYHAEQQRIEDRGDSDREAREPQYVVLNIGGHEAKGVIKYVTREQEREKAVKSRFRKES